MKTASKKPISMHAAMNSTPYKARFCSDSIQRSLLNSRSYCAMPTQSSDGKVRELVNEIFSDHSTVPM